MTFVSAVMPTTPTRLPFIEKSIKYFRAQTFLDAELVILSREYSPDIAKLAGDRVMYGADTSINEITGAMRNAVNKCADGKIIIHWDDDDWYAPERIADEVGFLISSGKQVIGYHDMFYYRPADQSFFKYRYNVSKDMPHYAVGTSQCYWREYWEQNPFRSIKVGEDSAFSIVASQNKVLTTKDNCGMLVALAHPGSTSKPLFGSSQFPRVDKLEAPQAFLSEVGL